MKKLLNLIFTNFTQSSVYKNITVKQANKAFRRKKQLLQHF